MDTQLIAQNILVHLYGQYVENGRDTVGFYFDLLDESTENDPVRLRRALNFLENSGYIDELNRDDMSAFITSEGITLIDNGGLSYIRELC